MLGLVGQCWSGCQPALFSPLRCLAGTSRLQFRRRYQLRTPKIRRKHRPSCHVHAMPPEECPVAHRVGACCTTNRCDPASRHLSCSLTRSQPSPSLPSSPASVRVAAQGVPVPQPVLFASYELRKSGLFAVRPVDACSLCNARSSNSSSASLRASLSVTP